MPPIRPSQELIHSAVYRLPEGLQAGIEQDEIPKHVEVVNRVLSLFRDARVDNLADYWFQNPDLCEELEDGRTLVVEYNLDNRQPPHVGHLLSTRVRVTDPTDSTAESIRVNHEAFIGARKVIFRDPRYGDTSDDPSRKLDDFFPGVVADYHKSITEDQRDLFGAVGADSERFSDIEDTINLIIAGATKAALLEPTVPKIAAA